MTSILASADEKQIAYQFLCELLSWLLRVDARLAKEIPELAASGYCSSNKAQKFLNIHFQLPDFTESSSDNYSIHLATTEVTAETLAITFEKTLSYATVKKQGAFYTPVAFADRLIEQLFDQAFFERVRTILDPACGSGMFLIRIIRKIPEEFLADFPELLRAVDIDSRALQIARLLVAGTLTEELNGRQSLSESWHRLENSFTHANFLLEETDNISRTTEIPCMPASFTLTPPTAIIGNPPYGLSRNEQLTPVENDFLQKKFNWARVGKVNKYLLFMAQAYTKMLPGDRLSFIVPNAWLGIRAGQKLRSLLLESKSLLNVHSFLKKPFDNASVEVVSFLIEKEAGITDISVCTFDSIGTTTPAESSRIPVSTCTQHLQGRIPLCWAADASTLLADLTKKCFPLDSQTSPFRPAIALQAYAFGKGNPPQSRDIVREHSFHHSEAIDDTCIPYLEGRDVERFSLNWSGRFLSYGPWLAEAQSIERFTGPRIIVREVVDQHPKLLKAMYTEEAFLYNKSCLHILPRILSTNTDEELFLALLGILNSTFASLLLKLTGNKVQRRLFPKIVNADLANFLLPRTLLTECAPLASLVRTRLSATNCIADIETEIDAVVLDLYEMPDTDRKRIRDYRFLY